MHAPSATSTTSTTATTTAGSGAGVLSDPEFTDDSHFPIGLAAPHQAGNSNNLLLPQGDEELTDTGAQNF